MPSNQPQTFPWDSIQAANQVAQAIITVLDHAVADVGNALIASLQPILEPLTELAGRVLAPLDNIPFMQVITSLPGLKWLLAAVGQVNQASVREAVADLRQTYPEETNRQLAQRVITASAMRAAQIGLVTNLVPSLALTLFLVDLGAIAALQADMIYRIAAIYGYSPGDATRRGEVLAIWLLFSAGGNVLKSGLSAIELIPGLGTVVGVASDASLLYGVGYLACRYYETKSTNPDGASAVDRPDEAFGADQA